MPEDKYDYNCSLFHAFCADEWASVHCSYMFDDQNYVIEYVWQEGPLWTPPAARWKPRC